MIVTKPIISAAIAGIASAPSINADHLAKASQVETIDQDIASVLSSGMVASEINKSFERIVSALSADESIKKKAEKLLAYNFTRQDSTNTASAGAGVCHSACHSACHGARGWR